MKVAVLWVPWCFIKYTISDISRKNREPSLYVTLWHGEKMEEKCNFETTSRGAAMRLIGITIINVHINIVFTQWLLPIIIVILTFTVDTNKNITA